MILYIETTCPGCSRRLRVREAYVGQSIVCNHCDHPFVAAPSDGGVPAASAAPRDASAEALQRIVELEGEADRLRAELANRTRDAEDAVGRSQQLGDELAEASAALRSLEADLLALRRRRESDAPLLRELGACLADRDRLRAELRDASAHRDAAEARAALVPGVEVERDRLDMACRELTSALERGDAERAKLHDDLAAAESNHVATRCELDEARRLLEAERTDRRSESDRLRSELDRAASELSAAVAALVAEKAGRARQVAAFEVETRRLRGELQAHRSEEDVAREEAAALTRDRDRLDHSLRIALADAEAARSRHAAESHDLTVALSQAERRHAAEIDTLREALSGAERRHAAETRDLKEASSEAERRLAVESRALSQALSEAEARHREAFRRLEDLTAQLQSTRDEMARHARERQAEIRGHALALEAHCVERDSERKAHLDQLDRERSSRSEERARERSEMEAARDTEREAHRAQLDQERSCRSEEAARHLREIAASKAEVDRLGVALIASREEAEGRLGEIERLRAEIADLAAEHEGLRDRHEALCRERDDLLERCLAVESLALSECEDPEIGHSTANGVAAASSPPPNHNGTFSSSGMVPAPPGWTVGAMVRLDVPVARRDAPGADGAEEDEFQTAWRLPEANDLASAREQLTFLSDLLRTAQEANARLSERLSTLKKVDASGPRSTAATPHAEPADARSAAEKKREEADWYLELARRAARLAERRKPGRW